MIVLVGVDYHNMSVTDRELFSLSPEELPKIYPEAKKIFTQVIFLSTCNRLEVCFSGQKEDHSVMINWLASRFIPSDKTPQEIEELKKKFYHFRGSGAITHLLEVAAGLHSMVMGENQILHQVKRAYQDACKFIDFSAEFHKLFQTALGLGKRVRSETDIGKGGMSLGSVSVDVIKKLYEKDSQFSVGLIGAGEIAEEVLKSLINHGRVQVKVSNRDPQRAYNLMARYKDHFIAEYVPFEERYQMVANTNVIVVSTNASEFVLQKSEMEIALNHRYRFSFFIDLSVPRNIDPRIAELQDLVVYTLDDLEKIISENYSQRSSQINSCHNLIKEELQQFQEWLSKRSFFSLKEEWKKLLIQINQQRERRQQSPIAERKLDFFLNRLYDKLVSQENVELWDFFEIEQGVPFQEFLEKTLESVSLSCDV